MAKDKSIERYVVNSCRNLRNRFTILKAARRRVEGIWDEIENYVLPFRGQFFKDDKTETDVEWRKRWIYDSVPVESAQTLAASLNGSLTTPLVRWFEVAFRDDELNSDKEARVWLDTCTEVCWQSLRESNFDLEANEAYIDLVGFGNAIVVEEIEGTYEDFQGLDFKAIPIKECFFEHNFKGQVKRFYRRVFLTAVQIVDRFGTDKVPDHILHRATSSSNIDEKHETIMCIYEREKIAEDIKQGGIDPSLPLPPERRPYGVKWFLERTVEQLGETGGYYEMPAFVVRWRKVTGSKWGHGPAHVAMGDILTLNQMVDFILSASEKVIDPATIAEDRGIIGDLDLGARGLTIVRKIDGIRPYESGARFDVSQLQREDLRQSIKRMFYVDQLELKMSPAMTATEVVARQEQLQRLLGPTLGRIQNDFLDPLIMRTFNILFRAGQFPEVPGIVAERRAEMDIEYMGPMARAQKSDQVQTLERFVMSMANIAQFYPEVLDLIDPMKMAREEAKMLSIPSRVLRSDAEIQQIKTQRQQQQQAMEAIALAQQGGQAMKQLGEGAAALQGGNGGQSVAGEV